MQSQPNPARQLGAAVSIEYKQPCRTVRDCYQILNTLMINSDVGVPVRFDEQVHLKKPFAYNSERYRFLQNIDLSVPVDVLRYSPGGSNITVIFISKSTEGRSAEAEKEQSVEMYEKVRSHLPVFHTRQMKTSFRQQFGSISKVTPALLETVYQQLTMDASAHSNPTVKERLRLIFLGETGLVPDLRELNQGRSSGNFE